MVRWLSKAVVRHRWARLERGSAVQALHGWALHCSAWPSRSCWVRLGIVYRGPVRLSGSGSHGRHGIVVIGIARSGPVGPSRLGLFEATLGFAEFGCLGWARSCEAWQGGGKVRPSWYRLVTLGRVRPSGHPEASYGPVGPSWRCSARIGQVWSGQAVKGGADRGRVSHGRQGTAWSRFAWYDLAPPSRSCSVRSGSAWPRGSRLSWLRSFVRGAASAWQGCHGCARSGSARPGFGMAVKARRGYVRQGPSGRGCRGQD